MAQWIFYDQTIFAIANSGYLGKTIYLPNDTVNYPLFWSGTATYLSGDVRQSKWGDYDEVWRSITSTNNIDKNPSGYSGSYWIPFRQGTGDAYLQYSGQDMKIYPQDGQIVIVKDETGWCNNTTNKTTIQTTNPSLPNGTRIDNKSGIIALEAAYGFVVLYRQSNGWFIIGESGVSKPY